MCLKCIIFVTKSKNHPLVPDRNILYFEHPVKKNVPALLFIFQSFSKKKCFNCFILRDFVITVFLSFEQQRSWDIAMY